MWVGMGHGIVVILTFWQGRKGVKHLGGLDILFPWSVRKDKIPEIFKIDPCYLAKLFQFIRDQIERKDLNTTLFCAPFAILLMPVVPRRHRTDPSKIRPLLLILLCPLHGEISHVH